MSGRARSRCCRRERSSGQENVRFLMGRAVSMRLRTGRIGEDAFFQESSPIAVEKVADTVGREGDGSLIHGKERSYSVPQEPVHDLRGRVPEGIVPPSRDDGPRRSGPVQKQVLGSGSTSMVGDFQKQAADVGPPGQDLGLSRSLQISRQKC